MTPRTSSIGRPLGGVLPVLCTPFLDDGRVDDASLRRLVDHELAAGVDGIVVHGLAGEAYKLSDGERQQVLTLVVYYVRLGGATGRPVIVQDAPAWTGIDFSLDLITAIATAASVTVSIKIEAPPTAPRIRDLREAGLDAIGGYGALHLAEELAAGISGFMPGCALPDLYVDIWRAHRAGESDRVYELFARALPLLAFQMSSLDTFIGAQKALLHAAGVISCAAARSPGTQLDDQQLRWLRRLLERTSLPRTSAFPQP